MQLPAPMTLIDQHADLFSKPNGLNGSVAISPWGDVHVTSGGEHLSIASLRATER